LFAQPSEAFLFHQAPAAAKQSLWVKECCFSMKSGAKVEKQNDTSAFKKGETA
jgi:hypothetical protein